jgi:hypothetical protein
MFLRISKLLCFRSFSWVDVMKPFVARLEKASSHSPPMPPTQAWTGPCGL